MEDSDISDINILIQQQEMINNHRAHTCGQTISGYEFSWSQQMEVHDYD